MLLDAGEITLDASAGFKHTTDLVGGLYYAVTGPTVLLVAILTDATLNLWTFGPSAAYAWMGFPDAASPGNYEQMGWQAVQAYGALPLAFPAYTVYDYSAGPTGITLYAGL